MNVNIQWKIQQGSESNWRPAKEIFQEKGSFDFATKDTNWFYSTFHNRALGIFQFSQIFRFFYICEKFYIHIFQMFVTWWWGLHDLLHLSLVCVKFAVSFFLWGIFKIFLFLLFLNFCSSSHDNNVFHYGSIAEIIGWGYKKITSNSFDKFRGGFFKNF